MHFEINSFHQLRWFFLVIYGVCILLFDFQIHLVLHTTLFLWSRCGSACGNPITMECRPGIRWPLLVLLYGCAIFFSCDQAALRTPLSVCLSVRPSVRPSVCLSVCLSVTPFSLCFCHRIATKFSGVITNEKSDVHAKDQGHRSKVKVTKVITQLSRFRTLTPVWIHIWW